MDLSMVAMNCPIGGKSGMASSCWSGTEAEVCIDMVELSELCCWLESWEHTSRRLYADSLELVGLLLWRKRCSLHVADRLLHFAHRHDYIPHI